MIIDYFVEIFVSRLFPSHSVGMTVVRLCQVMLNFVNFVVTDLLDSLFVQCIKYLVES